MTISLQTFRNIAATGERGFVVAKGPDELKCIGHSRLFGGLASARPLPRESANAELRHTFLDLLKAEYGDTFRNFQAAKLLLKAGKPLTLSEVQVALLEGDQQRQAKIERISVGASGYVQTEGLRAAKVHGGEVPGLSDAIGEELSAIIADINLRARSSNTGIKLNAADIIPRDMAEQLDYDLRQALIAAHGDPTTAKAIQSVAARKVMATFIRNHSQLKDLVSHKLTLLHDLERKGRTGDDFDYAVVDLLKGSDRSIDEFMARTHRSGPGDKGIVPIIEPRGDRLRLHNSAIDEALARRSNESSPADFFASLNVPESPVREFIINREVLAHFAEKVKQRDPKMAQALGQRSLAHLMRFAATRLNRDLRPENPLVRPGDPIYFRSTDGGPKDSLTKNVARSIGVDPISILPVTDERIMEVIKRDLVAKDLGQVFSLSDVTPTEEGRSFVDMEGQALFDIVKAALETEKPLFLDVTRFLAGTLHGHEHDFEELKMALDVGNEFLDNLVDSTVEEYVKAYNLTSDVTIPLDVSAAKMAVKGRLTRGALITVGKQLVLYTTGASHDRAAKPGNLYRQLASDNGFTVGPNQLFENWIEGLATSANATEGIAALSASLSSRALDFRTTTGGLKAIATVDGLMRTEVGASFAMLRDSTISKAVSILPAIALAMLRTLEQKGMDAAFEQAGIPELENYLLNHIHVQMLTALDATASGDQAAFLDAMELIHADIATMTAVIRPYGEGDFEAVMRRQWEAAKIGAPEEIKPKFSLTNSGMQSMALVLSSVERMLPEGALNIAVSNNSYYESVGVLSSARQHHTLKISDEDPGSSIVRLSNDLKPEDQVHLLVTEFHHNIGVGAREYRPVPVAEQIKQLLASNRVAPKLTVAIDDTISVPNDDDIRALLSDPVISTALTEGRLNLVTYRSTQKFDMAGYDNYNGGILCVLNDGSFPTFQSAIGSVSAELNSVSDINYQGLTLFQDAAGEDLKDYRRAIMANTQAFMALLDDRDLSTAEQRGAKFLQFAPNFDPSSVFVDIRLGVAEGMAQASFNKALLTVFTAVGQDRSLSLPAAMRPSFGFAHSNLTGVTNSRLRFTPGLEKTSDMARYKAIFDDVNTIFEALDRAPAEPSEERSSTAQQMAAFLEKITGLGERLSAKPHRELATIARAVRPNASIDDLKSAASILSTFGLPNLARELFARAEAAANRE